MKYVSIDVETTGTDADRNQVLEFAAVFEDAGRLAPLDELPFFHAYVMHPILHGHPIALAMNADIIKKLADHGMDEEWQGYGLHGVNFLHPVSVWKLLKPWLETHYDTKLVTTGRGRVQVNMFGKNPSFDRSFCNQLPGWEPPCIHYRTGDPAMLYTAFESDAMIPDTVTCAARAGIEMVGQHTALEDAKRVIELIRRARQGVIELIRRSQVGAQRQP